MKKIFIVLSIIILPLFALAQFSGVSGISDFSPWRLSGSAIQPKVSSWTLGSSGTPIGSGFFTNLTTSVMTISNSVTGNLTVNGGTINLGASPNTATTTLVANGSGQLTLTAAGTNQNVVLTPSGTGFTLLNGNVGIGTASPGNNKLVVKGGNGNQLVADNAGEQFSQVSLFANGVQKADVDWDANNNRMHIETSGANSVRIVSNASTVQTGWDVSGVGHLLAVTDNSFDIGANGATRPRNLYVGTNGIFGGNVGIGTTSPAAELAISSTATSTFMLGTGQSTTKGSCIQMYAPNGTAYRLYVSNGGTLTTESGACK